MAFCTQNQEREFFHLLKVLKGNSDINNYLIADRINILSHFYNRSFSSKLITHKLKFKYEHFYLKFNDSLEKLLCHF